MVFQKWRTQKKIVREREFKRKIVNVKVLITDIEKNKHITRSV